jgi:integrase
VSRTENEEGDTKTTGSSRTIKLLSEVVEALTIIYPLHAQPSDYIFVNQVGKPLDHEQFGERHFQRALRALQIRHRNFYSTRHTFISVQLSYGENPKQIADYVGNSPEVIFRRYGKYIRERGSFGQAAMQASKQNARPFARQRTFRH